MRPLLWLLEAYASTQRLAAVATAADRFAAALRMALELRARHAAAGQASPRHRAPLRAALRRLPLARLHARGRPAADYPALIMITDPQAVRFANETLRPLAEETRALVAKIGAAQTVWFSGVNAKFPNDLTALEDGRESEGVSRLTGADINNLMSALLSITPDAAVISKPCVRALQAS